jgi:hypothetical protein
MMNRQPRVGDVLASENFRFREPGNSYVHGDFTEEFGEDLRLYSVGHCREGRDGELVIEGFSDQREVKNRGTAEYEVVKVEKQPGGFDGHSPRQSMPDGKIVTARLVSKDLAHEELIQFNLNPGFRNQIAKEDLTLVSS